MVRLSARAWESFPRVPLTLRVSPYAGEVPVGCLEILPSVLLRAARRSPARTAAGRRAAR